MNLLVKNDIEDNVFSTTVTVDSYGDATYTSDEEKELLSNFPVSIAYRNMTFTKNVKINGTVPEVTSDSVDGSTVVEVTLPALTNREIAIRDGFNAEYKISTEKIPASATDANVLTTKELVAQARCLVFQTVVKETVAEKMNEIRAKAPSFEGETIVSV